MNMIAPIGHNTPPSAIDNARTAFRDLSTFLSDTPVIEAHETAKQAKLFLDRCKITLKELADARTAETAPLHDAWKAKIAEFKPAEDHLTSLLNDLKKRLQIFLDAEEAKRRAEAERIRKEAEAAILAAQEAERAEQEARDNAAVGEVGVDLGAAIEATDARVDEANRLMRQTVIAERDSRVRLAGGLGNAISVRSVKVPVVEDYKLAIKAMGLTDAIRDAILTSARAYKKLNGAWPKGIAEIEERKL